MRACRKTAAKKKGTESEEPQKEENEEIGIEEELEGEEVEHGKRKTKKVHDPKLPTEEEVKEHYLSGHMPYRSWCHHCVRGRGRERDHSKKSDDNQQGIPEYHMDYCFPGDEFGERLTVLVVIERCTKMKKAVVVPNKGSTGSFAAKMVLDLINECGDRDRDVILKTDQEPAIKFLVDDVCVNRTGARTIPELAPKNSKGSNGTVERAVQAVEQCLRTMKSSFDERMGVKVDVQHPVITWLCEFVGYMMNRMEVASDGKTPYERVKGKRGEMLGLEFGERVMWKHHPGKVMEKLNARWGNGLFLGVRARSNELIIIDETSKELKYVRTVRRVPEEQRWDSNNLQWVTMVPWNKGPSDKEADGDMPEFDVKQGPGRTLTEEEKHEISTNEAPKIVHRAHLRRTDFDKHGYTDRCPGCSAILRGLHVQPHSQACRERMEALLDADIRIKNAKVRLQERVKRKAEEDEETTKKKKPDEGQENAKRKVNEEEGDSKKRKLDEIEDQAMREEDPVKLTELFEEYRREYLKDRANEDEDAKRKRVEAETNLQERSSSSSGAAKYEEMEVNWVSNVEVDPWDVLTWGTAKVKHIFRDDGVMVTAISEEGAWKEWGEFLVGGDPTWEDYGFAEFAWDDVNNIPLPVNLVKEARREEMGHMKGKIFKVVKRAESWRMTGKAPITTKWVDTDKTHGTGEPMIRSRWVARDFKDSKEKDREDLFSATPPIEMMRLVLSRQATRRTDGGERKTMYLDVKKAHLEPLCEQDVYVELPAEAEVASDECGKLVHWPLRLPPGGPSLGGALLGTARETWVREVLVGAGRLLPLRPGSLRGCPRRRLRVGRPGQGPGLGAEGAGGRVRDQESWAIGFWAQGRTEDRHAGADHRAYGRGHHLAGRPPAPEVAGGVLRDGREHEGLEQERVRRGAGAGGPTGGGADGGGVSGFPDVGGSAQLHGPGQPLVAVSSEGDLP